MEPSKPSAEQIELHLPVLHVMPVVMPGVVHVMAMHVMVHVMVHVMMHMMHARRRLSRRRVGIHRITKEVTGVLVWIVRGGSNIRPGRQHGSKHDCNQKRGLAHRFLPGFSQILIGQIEFNPRGPR